MSKILNLTKNSIDFRKLANYALLNQDQDVVKFVHKFGQNVDVDTSSPEDVWGNGGIKSNVDIGETLNIASSSTSDTSAGTGARTVVVSGLDEDFNEVTDFIVLNGISNVLTTNSYIEVHRIVVYQAGSSEINVGKITATASGTSTVLATVEAGVSITQQTHYTVPAGYTAFKVAETVSSYRADGNGTRQAEITYMLKAAGDTAWIRESVKGVNSATAAKSWDVPLIVPEKTRMKYQAVAAANDTSVSVQYDMVLIKNTELL